MILDGRLPIVLAPLAGGPSTPALAAAVSNAGALGFLASGYLSADETARRIGAVRELTREPFGVNVFVPAVPAPAGVVDGYAAELAVEARRAGVALGEPRFDDDGWDAKLDLLCDDPVPVVSFTFGCPSADAVARLRAVGSEVWVTITSPSEAEKAEAVGADVLVVQGSEAGGHQGGFSDDDDGDGIGVLSLLQLVRARTALPLVATGGIMTGGAVAGVVAAGARAAALGTGFLLCPEAGTSEVHRAALRGDAPTARTRAFTGRTARGIRNRFIDEHSASAPAAYPEVHYLTTPLRQAGRAAHDPDLVNLWAGESYRLIRTLPAAELVRVLADEMINAARTT